uniref:Uncharacterized protein n=1 Tax=Molossus molossus TaxID=27622 RepID=A0A7J8C6C8_MOLMO|nr:hypothetical protein HJG59_002919 [Molossus molossus]
MHPASGRPGRGAPSVRQSTHTAHPGPKIQITGSKRPTGSQLQKPGEQVPPSKSEKEAILKRAEGRTRVPSRFRDGFKHFFFSPTGALKVLRMVSSHKRNWGSNEDNSRSV